MDIIEVSRRFKVNLAWNSEMDLPSLLDGNDEVGLLPPLHEDPRIFDEVPYKYHFRFLLDLCDDSDAMVQMDLSDLKNRTELLPKNLIEVVKNEKQVELSTSLPLLVVTEGVSDSTALSAAMEITHPHLIGFVNFMDFSYKAEGSAPNVAKTIRAMGAAGVPNRMVGIVDNDVAGLIELGKLADSPLPPNTRVIRYPDLAALRNYPTHSFGGSQLIDVDINGSAASLELYFGSDVLTGDDGAQHPIRWTTYSEKLKKNQGSVDGKVDLQRKFMAKVEQQVARGQNAATGDWVGISAIIDEIVHAFEH